MNTLKRNFPNFITLSNLFCGIISIICTFENHLAWASIFIFIGIFLDFFDGFFARILKVENKFGVELDSMADLITSGLAPSIILFQIIRTQTVALEYGLFTLPFSLISLLAFTIPISSAIRLAKFNLDENQKEGFIGLPTPVTAVFIASIPLIYLQDHYEFYGSTEFLFLTAIIFSLLQISTIKLFSLKFNFKYFTLDKLNIFRILILFISIILFLLFNFSSIPFIVILYIILSLINNFLK